MFDDFELAFSPAITNAGRPMSIALDQPAPFTRHLVLDHICTELMKGRPLTVICEETGMPNRVTVWEWCEKWPEVGQRVARARRLGEEAILDGLLAIMDDKTADPKDRKVRVWGRLELLKRLDPKRWGDQQAGATVNVGVNVANVISPEQIAEAQRRKRASIERRRAAQNLIPATAERLPENCPILDKPAEAAP